MAGPTTYRHFDLRVFNELFTLSMSELVFTQVVRSIEHAGLGSVEMDDTGYAFRLKASEEYRSIRFKDRYFMVLTATGIRFLVDALGNSQYAHIQALLGKIEDAFYQIKEWEEGRREIE